MAVRPQPLAEKNKVDILALKPDRMGSERVRHNHDSRNVEIVPGENLEHRFDEKKMEDGDFGGTLPKDIFLQVIHNNA